MLSTATTHSFPRRLARLTDGTTVLLREQTRADRGQIADLFGRGRRSRRRALHVRDPAREPRRARPRTPPAPRRARAATRTHASSGSPTVDRRLRSAPTTLKRIIPLPSSMRAVVLDAVPAPPEALVVRERPVPQPERGWVLIEVKAFGLNRSELKTRLGLGDPDVTFPRVPGIEATGVVAGYLSNEWIVPDFYPSGFLPNGVRLSGYFGEASDLPQAVLQEFLDAVAAGEATVPIAKAYTMDEIATAHDDMAHDRVAGKLVASTGR